MKSKPEAPYDDLRPEYDFDFSKGEQGRYFKRLLREAFEGVEKNVSAGHDVVVVARPEARELAEREGLAGMDEALSDLLSRAGLRVGHPGAEGSP